jgi:hypothetical protein
MGMQEMMVATGSCTHARQCSRELNNKPNAPLSLRYCFFLPTPNHTTHTQTTHTNDTRHSHIMNRLGVSLARVSRYLGRQHVPARLYSSHAMPPLSNFKFDENKDMLPELYAPGDPNYKYDGPVCLSLSLSLSLCVCVCVCVCVSACYHCLCAYSIARYDDSDL